MTKRTIIITLILILISVIVGVYLYPQLPEQVASHWNTQGEVDGYMSKFWGLFLMPIIALVILALFIVLPKIDPLKGVEKFRKYYDGLILLIVVFLFYIHTFSVLWNLGIRFDIGTVIIPALAVLFFYIGIMIEKSKRNWFVGIRTPWTLSSDRVWEKTNKLGGKMFKISAVIALFGFLVPSYAMYFLIVPVVFTALYGVVYSYTEYRKENI